jgi:lipopolysaccharide export system protein LptA
MKRWLILLLMSSLYAQNTVVKADFASYRGSHIYLTGHVTIEHALATVMADRACLTQDEKTATDFPFIVLEENVAAFLTNGGKIEGWKLECDMLKKQSFFYGSPRIHYHDDTSTIEATRAEIFYVQKEGKFEIEMLTLFGNVRLQKDKSQFALADRLDYRPQEKELTLTADPGGRVLFYDQEKKMELSAPKIVARGVEHIQGFGDVCFILNPTELEQLKSQFAWP